MSILGSTTFGHLVAGLAIIGALAGLAAAGTIPGTGVSLGTDRRLTLPPLRWH